MVILQMKTQWKMILFTTPRIASVHKSRVAVVMLVECWIEAVYNYVNGETLN